MKIEVVLAWPRRAESVRLELPEGARLGDAVAATGWSDLPEVTGYAVYGQRADTETVLRDGDRVELLRPLQADPKDARRKRAKKAE